MDSCEYTALQTRLDGLEARLSRFKAHNRVLTFSLAGLFAVISLAFILSAVPQWWNAQGAICANTIQIVDDLNAIRAQLGVARNNSVGLFLYDDVGRSREMLITEMDGTPAMTFYDEFGVARLA